MEQEIYLVRHGKIEWKNKKSYIGQMDLPLSKIGIEQAEKLNTFFSGIPLGKAYSSPLIRCMNTLEIILAGRQIPIIRMDTLKEIDMGDWDGKTFEEIKNNDPEAYEKRGIEIDHFTPPNGESFLALEQRVMPAFKQIIDEHCSWQNSDQPIIIVAHAGVIRVIITCVLGLDLKEIFKWPIPYGGVYRLCYDQKKEKWNCKNQ